MFDETYIWWENGCLGDPGHLLPETAGKETVQEYSGHPESGGFLWASHIMDRGQVLRPHCSSSSQGFPPPSLSRLTLSAPWWAGTLLWPHKSAPRVQADGSDTCLMTGVVPSSFVGPANPEKLLHKVSCDFTFYLWILKSENCWILQNILHLLKEKKRRIFTFFFIIKVIAGTC